MKKVRNWKGCGNCELCKAGIDCREFTREVRLEFIKNERWDNWGKMVTVFKKGTIVEGTAVVKDGMVYCASAEPPCYGVADFVDLENIEILERNNNGICTDDTQ